MLYLVVTPIGNLGDMSFRAVETLKSADLVLCEDTRRSRVLLSAYGIDVPVMSYERFSEARKADFVVGQLREGKNVALVTDAGTPVISDPGNLLVKRLRAEGLDYTLVGGGCAAVSALVLSGFDPSAFCFAGFLPEKNADRQRFIRKFASVECTLVFYVSPHAFASDERFLYENLGARKACLVREISKIYEEKTDFTLGDVPEDLTVRGEMVLVVEGAAGRAAELSALSVAEHLARYEREGLSEKEAMKAVARDRGVSKSEIYGEIKLGRQGKGEDAPSGGAD